MTIFPGFKISPLHSPGHNDPLLCNLDRRVGISPPRTESSDPLLPSNRAVGPYELNWETQQYKCWISNIITFALLALLQALNLFWLYCLLRSAFKFLVTGEKKDDRSEPDESEIEQDELKAVGGINGHASLNGGALPNGKS